MTSGHSYSWPSFKKLVALACLIAGLAVLWLAREILLLLFGCLLLGVFLSGITDAVVRYVPMWRGVALLLVLLCLTTVFGTMIWFLGFQFLDQFDELQAGLNKAVQQLRESSLVARLEHLVQWADWKPETSAAQLSMIAGYFNSGIAAMLAPVFIVVGGIYLAVDPTVYRRGLLALVPLERRTRVEDILRQAGVAMWGWLLGRMLSMCIIAATTLVGLWLLGMPMALSLALIAFVTNFVPYIGPASSAVPALLIALTISPTTALHVALLYIVIQGIETNLVTPLIVQRSIELPPVATLAAQMIFGLLCGLLGVLFATPLCAVAVVFIRTLYIEDTLGGDEADRGTPNAK